MKKNHLVALIAILAICSILLDYYDQTNLYRITKPLTTLAIIALATKYGRSEVYRRYWWFIVLGLWFCLGGDMFLLWEDYFIYGLASFLIGHLLFTSAFISVHGWSRNLMILFLLLIYGGFFFGLLQPHLGSLLWPVVFYVLCIILMAWQGIGLWWKDRQPAFQLVAVGVILFVLSDSILAYNKFVDVIPHSGVFVLSTYWAAVGMISYSTTIVDEDVLSDMYYIKTKPVVNENTSE